MLTLKFWHSINVSPGNRRAAGLLTRSAYQPSSALSNGLTILLVILFFGSIVRFPPLIFPIALHLSCLSLALKTAPIIAHAVRPPNRDMLNLTPMGEFSIVLDICRLCRDNHDNQRAQNREAKFGRGIMRLAGVTFTLLVLSFTAGMNSVLWGVTEIAIIVSGVAFLMFFEYRQSLVFAMLISIHMGISSRLLDARLFTFIAYASIQAIMYGLWLIASPAAYLLRTSVAGMSWDISVLSALAVTGAAFYTIREVAVVGLWYGLQNRMNEDLTALI